MSSSPISRSNPSLKPVFQLNYTPSELQARNEKVNKIYIDNGRKLDTAQCSFYALTDRHDVAPLTLKQNKLDSKDRDALLWNVLNECRACSKDANASVGKLESLLQDLQDLYEARGFDKGMYGRVLQELWRSAQNVREKIKGEDGTITFKKAPTQNHQLLDLLQRAADKKPRMDKKSRSCWSCLPSIKTVAKFALVALVMGAGVVQIATRNAQTTDPLRVRIHNRSVCDDIDPSLIDRTLSRIQAKEPNRPMNVEYVGGSTFGDRLCAATIENPNYPRVLNLKQLLVSKSGLPIPDFFHWLRHGKAPSAGFKVSDSATCEKMIPGIVDPLRRSARMFAKDYFLRSLPRNALDEGSACQVAMKSFHDDDTVGQETEFWIDGEAFRE